VHQKKRYWLEIDLKKYETEHQKRETRKKLYISEYKNLMAYIVEGPDWPRLILQ